MPQLGLSPVDLLAKEAQLALEVFLVLRGNLTLVLQSLVEEGVLLPQSIQL